MKGVCDLWNSVLIVVVMLSLKQRFPNSLKYLFLPRVSLLKMRRLGMVDDLRGVVQCKSL